MRSIEQINLDVMTVGAGRYAPSPSGPLHIGNLRTALAAWGWARITDRKFLLRNENLDPHRTGASAGLLADLVTLGIDWDGPVVNQTERLALYEETLADLSDRGLTFECYCSRKDIAEATRAPHSEPNHYPGTCQNLSAAEREAGRQRLQAAGRQPAIRLVRPAGRWEVTDMLHGRYAAPVDSFVLRRGDGAFAYNLACVVDDAHSGVDQVVRGGDLLPTAPAQAYLTHLLGFPQPTYGHVPLVVNRLGQRLAKRDGAVNLADLHKIGWDTTRTLTELSRSLGAGAARTPGEFLQTFDPEKIPLEPFEFDASAGLLPHVRR